MITIVKRRIRRGDSYTYLIRRCYSTKIIYHDCNQTYALMLWLCNICNNTQSFPFPLGVVLVQLFCYHCIDGKCIHRVFVDVQRRSSAPSMASVADAKHLTTYNIAQLCHVVVDTTDTPNIRSVSFLSS